MTRSSAYVFCRYQILIDEKQTTSADEFAILEKLLGKPIAYRKRDPKPDDFDTYLLKPRNKTIRDYRTHTWEVAQDLKYRERSRYNKVKDEIIDEFVETEEVKHTKFISIPRLGVMAVNDTISERSLGARSAVNRFVAIIQGLVDESVVSINFAGTPQDTQKALETWSLDEFSFTVRPFNPHPRKLGEKLHDLIQADNGGAMRATLFPAEGKQMRDSHEGIIAEAKGLSEAGYGQYGASGITPDGLHAKIQKPKFSFDKAKNSETQAKNRMLKVYVDRAETAEEEESAIVKALIDLYG